MSVSTHTGHLVRDIELLPSARSSHKEYYVFSFGCTHYRSFQSEMQPGRRSDTFNFLFHPLSVIRGSELMVWDANKADIHYSVSHLQANFLFQSSIIHTKKGAEVI